MALDEGAIRGGKTADGVVARFADRRAAERSVEIAQSEQFELAPQSLEAADMVVERGRTDAQLFGDAGQRQRVPSVIVGDFGGGADDRVFVNSDALRHPEPPS